MSRIKLVSTEWTISTFLSKLKNINLQPDFQREFVYSPEEQAKVIDSILLNLPLNIIYLNEIEDDKYEVIDGQQRLTSIVYFVKKNSPLIKMYDPLLNNKVWNGLHKDFQEIINNYILKICIATKENHPNIKYDLFQRINTVGQKLSTMELLNATFPGQFVSEIKKFCADTESKLKSITGKTWLRGETEEIVLKWFDEDIKSLLGRNQNNSANDYIKKIIQCLNWMETVVEPKFRTKIYGNDNCYHLYDKYYSLTFDKEELKKMCKELSSNQEIQNKKGILEYCLQEINGYHANEQLLNLRAFLPELKLIMVKEQNFKCAKCDKDLNDDKEYKKSELDHIISWKDGGLTEKSNCQLLCQACNRSKNSK